jgi:hypothetical protein
MSSYVNARDIKKRNVEQLFEKKNVVGVGVGRKIVNGHMTDEIAIKVYVEKKSVLSRLAEDQIIPKEIEGIKTDVVEVGKIRFQGRRDRNRPTQGGDSIGSCHSLTYGYIMAGTLGIPLIDKTDGKRVLLSNNHVIANVDTESENRASAGDDIVQPGTLDGGSCTTDIIGSLKRWVPFKISGDNYVDAAIADLDDEDDAIECQVGCDIGKITSYRPVEPGDQENSVQVQKCGRTTGYTTGNIIDIDATVNVGYEVLTSSGVIYRTIRFVDQILTTNMSDHGDSGSLLLDMSKKAVGLLFAGSDTVSVANKIEVVLDTLDLELCPEPDLHCMIGGPDRRIEICRPGGPNNIIIRCLPGRPDTSIQCLPGRPDQMILCRPGSPGMVIQCVPGRPDQFRPMCLACGPDSPIGCGSGGPENIIHVEGCAAGPTLDIRLKPGVDPKKLVVLDLDKIPRNMRASIEKMLEKMSEPR